MGSRISNMKIWVQLLLTIGVALLVVWSGVIVWQDHVYREAAIEQASDFSLSMHDATMAGLTGMMVTGTVQQRDVFLDQVKQLGTIRDLRVLRGDAVSKMFGAGNAKDQTGPDAVELRVLQTGKAVVQVESDSRGEYLRAVRPALAKTNSLGKNCIACHQVPENTVLGAVSMKLSLDHVNAGLAQQRMKSILAAIITCIPVLLLIYPFIHRVVTKPLEKGVRVARGIATGDLAQEIEVDSHNEIGTLLQALKDMNGSLVRIVRQVREGSDAIYGASRDIASGNADLSSRTEQQAGSLDKTAASMERLTGAVRQNAEHAREANRLAESASDVAAKGGAAVARVVENMDAINDSSKKIVDIIGVIDGIAFQTNILALNAAVEAARAGEQGRGFAVVAAEVRSLAQRSASAAKEIKALIGGSVEQVREGSTLVHQAGATMQEVVSSIKHVTDIMGEIAAASAEQTAGIEQVNHALTEMDAVTQQNAALVEQAAAASESLQDQAGHLERLVGVFKLEDTQASPPATPAAMQAEPPNGHPHRPELKLIPGKRA
ncbi:MAG TPA: methyl-accepting chemotaxis protein [Noviherbaspirillum sp.]|nr:methyl-accepting chemotaxis protein [Noviherbaspirillum sp.]